MEKGTECNLVNIIMGFGERRSIIRLLFRLGLKQALYINKLYIISKYICEESRITQDKLLNCNQILGYVAD